MGVEVKIGKCANVEMGKAKIGVGGDLINEGKLKAWETDLEVKGNIENRGEFIVNDPEKIKEILLEIARTTTNLTEIGKLVAKKIFGWSL